MTSIFQMRDLGGIEAFVLADDHDAASAMFEQHLRAHGGDPDAIMFRQVELDQVDEAAVTAVSEALSIGQAGVVSCDEHDRWSFLIPLSREVPNQRS